MPSQFTMPVCGLLLVTMLAGAQTFPRRAAITGATTSAITGNGGAREGKCTIEVTVDDVAEVEIHGADALLRHLSGQPPQWRRFQCTAPMPLSPLGFRFQRLDGRGKQALVEDPTRSGSAVIRIEDDKGGSGDYKFELMWNGAGDARGGTGGFGGVFEGGRDRDRDRDRGFGARTGFDETIRSCEDAVIDKAMERLRPQVIVIRRTASDDNPGRQDWIVGTFEVRKARDWDRYRFECSVNFSTGRVRSADFRPAGRR